MSRSGGLVNLQIIALGRRSWRFKGLWASRLTVRVSVLAISVPEDQLCTFHSGEELIERIAAGRNT
jgi:hypothetical protein